MNLNMNDIGPLPRDAEAERIGMALQSLLETFKQRGEWLSNHQAEFGMPDSDSPADALASTLNVEVMEMANCIALIGQIVANDLLKRDSAGPSSE